MDVRWEVHGGAERSTSSRVALVMLLFVLLPVVSSGTFGCTADDASDSIPETPDVLLVVLDTVRADHMSTYGYPRPTTIQVDALAEAGVVFEDVTAPAPWTYPSHASLFTGEPPWVHGARFLDDPADAVDRSETVNDTTVSLIRPDLPTLAERFAGRGYRTVAIVRNVWLTPKLGLVRGFQTVKSFDRDGPAIEAARHVSAREKDRPLFLFVNLLAAHSPYREGPGPWRLGDPTFLDPDQAPAWVQPYLFRGDPPGVHLDFVAEGDEMSGVMRYIRGDLTIPEEGLKNIGWLYDAGVRAADYGFGRILASWLDHHAEGIVAVTSDHGEALGEHRLLSHRGAVYPELLRVPLIIAAPGQLPTGVRVSTPVQLQDLCATLLDLAGIESTPASLVPVIEGAARPGPLAASARPDPMWAKHGGPRFQHVWRLYRSGNYAAVWSEAGDVQLYALDSDPEMRKNLAAQESQRVAALRAEAEGVFVEAAIPTEAAELPEETARRLRSLGYLE